MRGRKPEWQKRIARERIRRLFELADEMIKKDPELSKRYIYLAKRIGMKYLVRIPKNLKKRVCKYCGAYLKPGITCSVRVDGRKTMLKISCWNCGKTIKRCLKDKNEKGDG